MVTVKQLDNIISSQNIDNNDKLFYIIKTFEHSIEVQQDVNRYYNIYLHQKFWEYVYKRYIKYGAKKNTLIEMLELYDTINKKNKKNTDLIEIEIYVN